MSPTSLTGATTHQARTLLASVLAVPLVIVLMLLAFLAPAISSGAKDLPLAVAAPEAAREQLTSALATSAPDAFDVTFVDDAAAVTDSVRQREAVGGIVVDSDGIEVITASGAGTPYATLLSNMATGLQAQQEQQAAQQAAQQSGQQESQAPESPSAAQGPTTPSATASAAPSATASAGGSQEEQPGQAPQAGAQAATQAAAQTVTVTDVAPLTEEDPTGVGLTSLALPLVFGGMASGVLLTVVVRTSWWRRALAAVGIAALGGLLAVLVLQTWFGAVAGSFALTWLGLTLGISAISLALIGLYEVLGYAGIVLGAVTMLFISNPLSGMATGWQWLPSGWGTLGQMLPVGAAGTMLRSAAYFDGAGMGSSPWVLAAWCACGLLLMGGGAWVRSRRQA